MPLSSTAPGSANDQSFVNQLMMNEDIHIHGDLNTYVNFNEQRQATQAAGENTELDDFKNKVKIWMRLDNETKELTNKIRMLDNERKQRKKYMTALNPSIMEFMSKNDIEELNSKDGRLLFKSSFRKVPLSNSVVKTKLYEQFPSNHEQLDNIFVNREKTKKNTLKRLV